MSGSNAGEEELRQAIRIVCDDAHSRGAKVEQVIVLMKQEWAALEHEPDPEGWWDADRTTRDAVLNRTVRVLIEEFYHG